MLPPFMELNDVLEEVGRRERRHRRQRLAKAFALIVFAAAFLIAGLSAGVYLF